MDNFWDIKREEIGINFINSRPNFLKNKVIQRIMHNNDPSVVTSMLEYVGDPQIADIVKDPSFGSPTLTGKWSLPTARNLFYRHIMKNWFDVDNIKHITDFGGGYGNNCRLWYKLGFSGDFALVDVSQVLGIQQYYLRNVLKEQYDKIKFYEDVSQINEMQSKSLFFATFSLSETAYEIRNSAIPKIIEHDYIFIVHNAKFPAGKNNEEIDNIEYFSNFKNEYSDKFKFIDFENTIQRKANYVIGVKK